MFRSKALLVALITCLTILCPELGEARPLYPRVKGASKLTVIPIGSQQINNLTLIYSQDVISSAETVANGIHREFQNIAQSLGEPKGLQTQIRIMDADRFYRETQLPTWTNAIYLDNQIVIPLKKNTSIQTSEINRAIRHELVHAVVDHHTNGSCPGWFDEGLAQLIEGPEHPVLMKALKKWVTDSGAIPFQVLQTGFTKLSRPMVPAAYAQSYFAVQTLKDKYGYRSFHKLFKHLKDGKDFSGAFQGAFNQSVASFEKELQYRMQSMVRKDRSQKQYVYTSVKNGHVRASR